MITENDKLREGVAGEIAIWCDEQPEVLIDTALLIMDLTGNRMLTAKVKELTTAFKVVEGETVADWFLRGISLGFMYFAEVAHNQPGVDVRVVDETDLIRVEAEIRDFRSEEPPIQTTAKMRQLRQEMEKPLTAALYYVLHSVTNEEAIDQSHGAFINGAILIDKLMRPRSSNPEEVSE